MRAGGAFTASGQRTGDAWRFEWCVWGAREAAAKGCASGRCGAPRAGCRGASSPRDFYDAWLPELAPSEALVRAALQARDARSWQSFERRYRTEMKRPAAGRLLVLLAALSRESNLSVGCYCEDEARCHRSVLRELLREHGAALA